MYEEVLRKLQEIYQEIHLRPFLHAKVPGMHYQVLQGTPWLWSPFPIEAQIAQTRVTSLLVGAQRSKIRFGSGKMFEYASRFVGFFLLWKTCLKACKRNHVNQCARNRMQCWCLRFIHHEKCHILHVKKEAD